MRLAQERVDRRSPSQPDWILTHIAQKQHLPKGRDGRLEVLPQHPRVAHCAAAPGLAPRRIPGHAVRGLHPPDCLLGVGWLHRTPHDGGQPGPGLRPESAGRCIGALWLPSPWKRLSLAQVFV